MRTIEAILVALVVVLVATTSAAAQTIENADGICDVFTLARRTECAVDLEKLRMERRVVHIYRDPQASVLTSILQTAESLFGNTDRFNTWKRRYSDEIPGKFPHQ